jgi:hypothetical protein
LLIPSLLASRTFLSPALFAGAFSVFTAPLVVVLGVIFPDEAGVGKVGDEAFCEATGFVVAVEAGFSFCAATSFFHFLTVSFAKSATFLSS